ncbi:hypothetical protein [Metabacillus halosaccharovorans]|uniref:hypothetical protein n=1 Tax=Metabacillus halosaccharovorans TaxID=930124 RepID=UPI001C1F2EE6|nr:hypothetical protein [Metabacillus halosaccharovorans]MBU7595919.1 hypothetical protein [Metabacillus halosaccharovorans]
MEQDDVKVIFPNDLLDSKDLMGVITNPNEKIIGFAVFSETNSWQENPYLASVYLLGWNHGLGSYQVIDELYTFDFPTEWQREKFYSDLPTMSALELMIF